MKRKLGIVSVLLLVLVLMSSGAGYLLLLKRNPGAYFEQNGIRLFYSEAGSGESVILLHGFAVNGDLNWRLTGMVKALSKEYHVVVLDQRGHGLSSKPHDPGAYGVEMAHDIVRLMDHLHIDRAHVAGYSLGGYVALKAAALYPDRLLTAAVLGAGWQDPDEEHAQDAFIAFVKIAEQLESGRGVDPVATMFGEGRHKPTAWHRLQVRLVSSVLGEKKALGAMLRNVRGLTLARQEVAALRTPVLVVCGDRDPNYTSAVNLEEALPGCEFITVPNRSHPATAMSDELRVSLLEFLKNHREKTLYHPCQAESTR